MIFSHVEAADDRVWMRADGVSCFAGDLSEEEQRIIWATHAVRDVNLFSQIPEGVAWKSKPTACVVADNDRTVHPDLQRRDEKRMNATTFASNSSPVVMLSKRTSLLTL
jgi:hypothetical protein